MKSKQFAWLYLIKQGQCGVEPSYYGGFDIVDKRLKEIKKASYFDHSQYKELYFKEIKAHGVDWDKTQAPVSDMYDKFNGTFADSTSKEYLKGELILKNGSRQTWMADAIEVTNVFDMMERVSEAEVRFKEIFGE